MLDAFNWADWTIASILGLSAFISLWRGFVREAFSLAGWLLAYWVAMVFQPVLAQQLAAVIKVPSLQVIVAFIVLFGATLLVASLVARLIGHLIALSGLGVADRLLGIFFGAARGGVVVLAAVLLVPQWVPVVADSWWKESQLIPHFLLLDDWFRHWAGLTGSWLSQLGRV